MKKAIRRVNSPPELQETSSMGPGNMGGASTASASRSPNGCEHNFTVSSPRSLAALLLVSL